MKISIIVVCYKMRREIARTLTSLQRPYQRDVADLDYEVIIVENGSPNPLPDETLDSLGPQCRYVYLEDPPPSPAYALNYGVELATGDVVCLMVDGATLISPGVLDKVRRCFTAYENPVVGLKYFFLGPGEQNETIMQGYNQQEEDRLLASINWPDDGYRLFEISTPIRFPGQKKANWLDKIVESTCLCMRKDTFRELGGCDEGFDFPGGGLMNVDIFQRAVNKSDTTAIILIGEGVFHQFHGGTTTNVTPQDRQAEVQRYAHQYRALRGADLVYKETGFYYFGNQPNDASKIQSRDYPERQTAPADSQQ